MGSKLLESAKFIPFLTTILAHKQLYNCTCRPCHCSPNIHKLCQFTKLFLEHCPVIVCSVEYNIRIRNKILQET